MDDSPSVFQCVLFGALGLLALLPLVSLLCKSTALRECAAEWGCWRCIGCCDRLFGGPRTDANDLEAVGATAAEPRTIAAYYQLLYAHRGAMHHQPCLALGLTTWREDVRHYVPVSDVFDMKLQQIQIRDEAIQRYEPPMIPLSNTDVQLTHPQAQGARDTVLCGEDEEEEKGNEA